MEGLAEYGSSDDEDVHGALLPIVQAPLAPQLAVAGLGTRQATGPSSSMTIFSTNDNRRGDRQVGGYQLNTKVSDMYAPIQGPDNPFKRNSGLNVAPTGIRGSLDTIAIEDHTFNEQFRQAAQQARRTNNSLSGVVSTTTSSSSSNKGPDKKKRKIEDQKALAASLGDGDGDGPWGAAPTKTAAQIKQDQDYAEIVAKKALADAKKSGVTSEADAAAAAKEEDEKDKVKSEKQKAQGIHVHEMDSEAEHWERMGERKMGMQAAPKVAAGTDVMQATSIFHGDAEVDYQGRPWTHPPAGVRADEAPDVETNYIPKKCIKKFSGHSKGVQAIQFLPSTGHLLLSAGMEGKCKVWDIYGDRQVKRTYHGHTEAVRAISFSNTGIQFLSCGYDRLTRLWDTETGQAVGTFTNRKMGYECKFYPNDNNIFLVPCSDNKIYQWDVRTGDIVQEYSHHLGPVNTVTFFDEGRKFFSTSDDKKILSWEFDINVPIRTIADQDMYSIASVTMHPSHDHWVGQSMDNTIVTYSCQGEKIKLVKKKLFKGHNTAGYACQVGISTSGQFLSSGDGFGNVHVWDWKTCKSYRKFQAHDNGPCMGNVWHPRHPSWMATCGWDGLIKLWE